MKRLFLSLALASSLAFANEPKEFNPFEEIQRIQQEMDRLFMQMQQNFFAEPMFKDFQLPQIKDQEPKLDLIKKEDSYIIKTDIPGATKDGIKITTKNNILTIQATIQQEKEEKKQNFIKKERFIKSYSRSITLPKDADTTNLKTKYENGVLTITIPRKK